MDFNFSEVLSRAWQITWKHKALWGASFVLAFETYLRLTHKSEETVLPEANA